MTISDAYRAEQTKLHANPHYGEASIGYAPLVELVVSRMGVRELLDYGAGKGHLERELKTKHPALNVRNYDPAIPAWSTPPASAEMVACIDVLEHIEPEYLDPVLDHLRALTRRVGVFTVHCGAAARVLSDGRNAHLIQKPASWWLPQIMRRFELVRFDRLAERGFWVIVEPL